MKSQIVLIRSAICGAVCVAATYSLAATASVNLDQKIQLELKNATVGEVLDEISKQTNVDFVISIMAPLDKKISIEVKDATLKHVMDSVAKTEKINWKIEDDHSIKISVAQ